LICYFSSGKYGKASLKTCQSNQRKIYIIKTANACAGVNAVKRKMAASANPNVEISQVETTAIKNLQQRSIDQTSFRTKGTVV
jgi:hypothetical protein